MAQDLLIIEALQSHSDKQYSVGFLWMIDQPDAETSTIKHTTFTWDIRASGEIRTHDPSKREAAEPTS